MSGGAGGNRNRTRNDAKGGVFLNPETEPLT